VCVRWYLRFKPSLRDLVEAMASVACRWRIRRSCAGRQQREPTKLEYGLLGALLASIALAFLFWLGIQLSILTLIVS
jgi:hypothetical protein